MIDYNKSPLTISGKVAVGVARHSRNFSGHPYIERMIASHGFLCDITAFLLALAMKYVCKSTFTWLYENTCKAYILVTSRGKDEWKEREMTNCRQQQEL